MTEKWKQIKGFYGAYEISNLGNVRSWKNCGWGRRKEPKEIKPYICKSNGYFMVSLWKRNKGKFFTLHRLLAIHFLGLTGNLQVNHKDSNRTNNDLSNLELVTSQGNTHHAAINLRLKRRFLPEDIKTIRSLRKNTGISMRKIARIFKTKQSTIWNILNKRTWAWL